MNDKKLGVAIHGAGAVSYAHVDSWKRNPHVEVVSISSRSKDSAQRLANYAGLECSVRDNFISFSQPKAASSRVMVTP